MAISVNWGTHVIYVPRADLVSLGGDRYQLDVNAFRLALRALECSDEGMASPDTHEHDTARTLAGVSHARRVLILDPYRVEFEPGLYQVECVGANHNISDVKIVNSVSLIIGNSAGLVQVSTGSGLSTEEHDAVIQTNTRVDASVSSRATPGQGLTSGQASALATIASRVDQAVSSLVGAGVPATLETMIGRMATILGVPGQPAQTLTSSGTVGAGGVLTTLRWVGGRLWGTVVTGNAGTATEHTTSTPENLP